MCVCVCVVNLESERQQSSTEFQVGCWSDLIRATNTHHIDPQPFVRPTSKQAVEAIAE